MRGGFYGPTSRFDDLWTVIDPLLFVVPERPKGECPLISDRFALMEVVFVLLSGIP